MSEHTTCNDALLREFIKECRRLWGQKVVIDLHWSASGKWLANVETARGWQMVKIASVFITPAVIDQLKRCEQKGDWQ